MAQILKSSLVNVRLLVILIGFEEVDALLNLHENFLEFTWVLYRLFVVQDIGALLLILVVLLMLFDFTDHAC